MALYPDKAAQPLRGVGKWSLLPIKISIGEFPTSLNDYTSYAILIDFSLHIEERFRTTTHPHLN